MNTFAFYLFKYPLYLHVPSTCDFLRFRLEVIFCLIRFTQPTENTPPTSSSTHTHTPCTMNILLVCSCQARLPVHFTPSRVTKRGKCHDSPSFRIQPLAYKTLSLSLCTYNKCCEYHTMLPSREIMHLHKKDTITGPASVSQTAFLLVSLRYSHPLQSQISSDHTS